MNRAADSDPPPVLKVRKDAEREAVFHYRREERLARPEAPRPRSPGRGGFRRLLRRGRLFTLPVLLLGVGAVLLVRVLPRQQDRVHLAGFDAVLHLYAFEDELLASVVLTAKPEPGETLPGGDARARFRVTETGATTEEVVSIDSRGATIRTRLPADPRARRVVVELSIGEKTAMLAAPIPPIPANP